MPTLTPIEDISVSVQQPIQPQPQPLPNTPLVDGATWAVIVTCVIGIVKMASPVLLGTFKSGRDEQIQAQKESRQSELSIEAATAATMRTLLEQNSSASISMNRESMEALSGYISHTLDAVVGKLSELSKELEKVSDTQSQISTTQSQIATTQVRTLELLASLEENIRQDFVVESKPIRRLDRRRD